MENEQKLEIFNALVDVGCCKRCILRFLGDVNANFADPDQSLKTLKFLNVNQENGDSEHVPKKFKGNICTVCLDLLQDSVMNELLSHNLEEVEKYDSETFVNYISFPKAVMIREHAMEIYMTDRFPEFYKDHNIFAVNKSWSLSIKDKLCKKVGKTFKRNSKFLIQFTVSYAFEEVEAEVMYKLDSNLKKFARKDELISRNAIGESLKNIDKAKFIQNASVPPAIPTESVKFDTVVCSHEPVYIAGRYCKYSRNLGQTPWIIDNVRVVESSVQEIIFEQLEKVLVCRELTFSSSGREDFNARMLGNGRPFFVKLSDPKTTKVPNSALRAVELEIMKTELVSVNRLQFIEKTDLNIIKDGEQFKKKKYKALCIVEEPEKLAGFIDKINSLSTITVQQKTPIRVFHRRSCGDRQKEIYEIHAEPIAGKDNLFVLDLQTQAGTYVKEFIHGDLGRTKPSLGNIIGGRVDIVALDVMDIDLEFPPAIKDEETAN